MKHLIQFTIFLFFFFICKCHWKSKFFDYFMNCCLTSIVSEVYNFESIVIRIQQHESQLQDVAWIFCHWLNNYHQKQYQGRRMAAQFHSFHIVIQNSECQIIFLDFNSFFVLHVINNLILLVGIENSILDSSKLLISI